MFASIVLVCTTVILLLTFALMREFRLRRALQELLRRILEKWRADSNAKH